LETTESNNTSARPLQIGPDLIISSLSAPTSAGAGQSISVSETTRNQAGGPAATSLTQYFLSLNGTLDAGDIALGARNVPALSGGASSSASASLTIPANTTAGNWFLIVKADAQETVLETAETNNVTTWLIRIGPDLTISALSAPAAVGEGQSITVTDTTKNQGSASAPPSLTRYFLSADTAVDAGDTLLGSRTIPALAAGSTSSGSVTLTIPAGTGIGTRYLIAVADAGGTVAETNEANNTNAWTMQIGADLIVLALTAPSTSGAGLSIIATDTTKNQGGAAAAASVTRFFLSSNTTYDAGDIMLGSRSVPAVNAGASATGSATLTIPAATATGTWYLIARADADDALAETSEGNNTSWRSLQIGADLTVSAFTVPSSAGAGQSITLTDTTANQGGGAAQASVTRYYLSADSTLDASDALLASRDVAALGPGASSAGSIGVTLPAVIATATWYLIAQTDAAGSVVEVSEFNNTTWRTLQIGVDLTVSALSVPAGAAPGQTITVTDTTRNQGSASEQASLTQYYLSANSTLETSDVLLGARTVAALGSGASSTGSTALTLPANTAAGTWYVIAKADGEGTIAETSETNNTSAGTLQIGADLIVYSLTLPTTAAAGQTLSASDTIRNQGGGPAEASVTRYFLSANNTLEAGDTVLGERGVAGVAAGATSAGPVTLVIPSGTTTGTWYLLVRADADGNVAETSETNNVTWRGIQIGPDLAISGASSPSSAAGGQGITISETTINQGGAAAPPSVTRYFLSSNWMWDAGDLPLGSRDVGALAGAASSAGSSTLTIPAGTTPGTWYLIVVADGNGAIVEAAENNNVFYRSIQVTSGP
jgi:subtilase family serine protease